MRPPVLLLVVALAIFAIAAADHTWKQRRMDSAERSEWYCVHTGTRCGGPSSAAIERHWNERELVYEIIGTGLAATAATMGLYRIDRRWRRA